jgi:benzil reductase ((S)-benzoin forming)
MPVRKTKRSLIIEVMGNKIAVVTGSSYGIGLAIVSALLAEGYLVYGLSRTKPLLNDAQFKWTKIDLLNPEEILQLTTAIVGDHIDVLINNAGTAIIRGSLDLIDSDFEQTFGLNFIAPIRVVSALQFQLRRGIVINISSISDRLVDKEFGLYSASKAALNIYFETIALENNELKVINLLPDMVETPLLHKLCDDDPSFRWDRCMKPEQIAESIVWTIKNQKRLESGSRIIVLSKELIDDAKDPEKLWVYNVDDHAANRVK